MLILILNKMFFSPSRKSPLSTGAFTDDNIFPVGDPELAGVPLVQVEDVQVLEDGGGAAGVSDLGPAPSPPT